MSTGRIRVAKATNNASTLPEIGKINLESFHTVDGYPNYLISRDGKIYSKRIKRLMVLEVNKGGYLRIRLYNGEGSRKFLVHRLVALNFIPNKENNNEVNHIDGNKANNSVDNLEWCTTKQNHKHAEKTGLKAKGNTHGMSKLTDAQRQEIVDKYIPWKNSSEMLGREYGVTGKTILYVLRTFNK